MTTISPNRRRARHFARRKLLFIGALLLLAVGGVALMRAPLSGTLWFAAGPLLQMRNAAAAAFSDISLGLTPQEQLVRENNALRAQLASTSVLLADRNALYAENSELKALLGRTALASSTSAPLLAAVLMRPPATPYDTLTIDAGSSQGVQSGDLISAGGSTYIGTVDTVYASASRVVLFSAPGESHKAMLTTGTASSTFAHEPIVLSGQGGGALSAEVPAGVLVKAGDEVTFDGIEPALAARVVEVEKKDDSSFQTIYLHLPVNIFSLRYVEVRRAQTVHAP